MKTLLAGGALVLATLGRLWACAFVEPLAYNLYSLFNPDICGQKDYAPFYKGYLSSYELHSEFSTFLSRSNAEEWKRITSFPGAIEEVIAGLEEPQDRDLYAIGMTLDGVEATAYNSFINHLIRTGNKSALTYLFFAKKCEPHVNRVFSWFDDGEAHKPDKAAMRALKDEALALIERHPAFKHRFLFQAVRLLHYAGDYAEALQVLEKNPVPESDALYPRMLRHKAGLLIKTGRTAEGYGLIAELFARPGWNYAAYIDFRLSPEEFQALVSSNKISPQSLAWAHALHGLKNHYSFNLDELKALSRLAPKSPALKILLANETQKMESRLLLFRLDRSFDIRLASETAPPAVDEPSWWTRLWRAIVRFFRSLFGKSDKAANVEPHPASAFDDEYYTDALADLDLLRNFVASLPDEDFFHVVAQYLAFLGGDFTAAQKTVSGDELLSAQSRLVASLAAVKAPEKETVAQILNDSRTTADNNAVHRTACALLGRLYFNAGDKVSAFLLFAQSDFTKEAAVLAEMFMTEDELKSAADALKQPAVAGVGFPRLRYKPEDLVMTLGIRKMREGQFDQAVKIFESLPAETWKQDYVYSGPMDMVYGVKQYLEFSTSPVHNPYDHPMADFKTYNKLSFAREAAGLLQAAQTSPERADLFYMRLGNLFYHSPYWGYNENLWDGEWLSVARTLGWSFPLSGKNVYDALQKKLNEYKHVYASRKISERFYAKAAEITKDPETAAKALILAHQSSQTGLSSLHWDWGKPDSLTPYLARLQKEFSTTAAFKDLPHTCPGLAKFLNVSV